MNPGYRKALKISLWVFATLVLLFFAGEISLRLMGWKAWQQESKISIVNPGGSLFEKDEVLGYKLRGGSFEISLDGKLTFTASHDASGHRQIISESDSIARPEIWIFGCSFTYGWGVNDEETWPSILADSLPQFRIVNFSAPAYGTVHAWLQYQDALKSGRKPAYAILAYGGFHNQRNVCDRLWKKALAGQKVMEGIRYPYAFLADETELMIDYSDLTYNPWAFMGSSAFIHFLEQRYDETEEVNLQGFDVTRDLIFRMKELSEEVNAKFIVAGIWKDGSTTEMLNAVRAGNSIQAIDISAGQSSGNCILPGDPHPNARAHAQIAQNFLDLAQIHE